MKVKYTDRMKEREELGLLTADSKPPSFRDYYGCECHASDHALRVSFEDWNWNPHVSKDPVYHKDLLFPETLTIELHLTAGDLWHRLKTAWAYVCGKEVGYFYTGNLMKVDDAKKLLYRLAQFIDWEDRKEATLWFDKETERMHAAGEIDHNTPGMPEDMGA